MPDHKILALKVDVDTERGTRLGVPNLLSLFESLQIQATFFFSLGPDNTGRALKRVFRPGFLKKVSRTSIVKTYGIRTLLNGILWPGPHIGKRHVEILQSAYKKGHEVGIHSYDHTKYLLSNPSIIPIFPIKQGFIAGRSGRIAMADE